MATRWRISRIAGLASRVLTECVVGTEFGHFFFNSERKRSARELELVSPCGGRHCAHESTGHERRLSKGGIVDIIRLHYGRVDQ